MIRIQVSFPDEFFFWSQLVGILLKLYREILYKSLNIEQLPSPVMLATFLVVGQPYWPLAAVCFDQTDAYPGQAQTLYCTQLGWPVHAIH